MTELITQKQRKIVIYGSSAIFLCIIYGLAILLNVMHRAKIEIDCDPTYYQILEIAKSWQHIYTSPTMEGKERNFYDYQGRHYTFVVNKKESEVRKEIEAHCPMPPWGPNGPDGEQIRYWSPVKIPPLILLPDKIQLAVQLNIRFSPGKSKAVSGENQTIAGTEDTWTTVFIGHYIPAQIADQEFRKFN